MMTYKGYEAAVEYDDDSEIFHGEVINLRDVITFQGKVGIGVEEGFRRISRGLFGLLQGARRWWRIVRLDRGAPDMKKKGRIGSSFDDFLKQEGIYEEVTTRAIKRAVARDLAASIEQDRRWPDPQNR
jgi:hypothetical protein